MPVQRRTAAVAAAQRSAFAQLPGVSPWVAVLIAATASLVGFAIESGSGHRDLGAIFALCYAAGCIAAVLMVRQSAVFTAVIQPPLLLFVAVPLAYFLIHRSEVTGLKGFLITCGYPLIERFPVMLFTSAAVLVIGMARWYFATSVPEITEDLKAADADAAPAGLFAALAARLSQIRHPEHGIDRSAAAARPARAPRREPDRPSRARHVRPERGTDRRGDRDPQPRRQSARPVRDAGAAERRRPRPRPVREPEWAPEPQRRAPRERRDPYPPRSPRGGGYPSHEAYPPFDPNPPRRGPRPAPMPRERDTHHPVSRVRYRSSDPNYPDYPDYPPPRGR